jgi:membrane protein YdbS with pleckstrin-like domain
MKTGRQKKTWNLNHFVGLLGALVYMIARFVFQLPALSSVLILMAAVVVGIVFVRVFRKKDENP